MNKSAVHVMRTFYPNIILAYGQSDEYSFVIRRLAYFFNRRSNKITSLITSAFTSAFVYYWPQYFHSDQNKSLTFRPKSEYNVQVPKTVKDWKSIPLRYPPSFDGRAILYPNERTLKDYLRWRQVDCHINNLFNTTFYALTGEYTRYIQKSEELFDLFIGDPTEPTTGQVYFSHKDATNKLSGTSSSDKNEILFTDYSVNYNNELEQFRKGTVWVLNPPISDQLDQIRLLTLEPKMNLSKTKLKKSNKFEEEFNQLDPIKQETYFSKFHCDIIGDSFWEKFGQLLQL